MHICQTFDVFRGVGFFIGLQGGLIGVILFVDEPELTSQSI